MKGEGSAYDPEKDMVRVSQSDTHSKHTILKKMRSFVEEYNFEEAYKGGGKAMQSADKRGGDLVVVKQVS